MKTSRKTKRLFSVVLALVLVVAFASSALAYIDAGYLWADYFAPIAAGSSYTGNVVAAQRVVVNYPGIYSFDVDGSYGPVTGERVSSYRYLRGLPSGYNVDSDAWQNMQYRLTYASTMGGVDYYYVDTSAVDFGQGLSHTTGTYIKHYPSGTWAAKNKYNTYYNVTQP